MFTSSAHHSWYNLLNDNYRSTMSRIKMNFPNEWKLEKKKLMKSSRNFTKMRFSAFETDLNSKMCKVMWKISQKVEFLELYDLTFSSAQLFYEFLACFPNIRTLIIRQSIFRIVDNKSEQEQRSPELKLQTLVFKDMYTFTIHEILTKINLQSEKIIFDADQLGYYPLPENFDEIGVFFGIQENLTCLGVKCSEREREDLFKSLTSKMRQTPKIRDFFVIFTDYEENQIEDSSWDSFVKFLDLMKSSLRCLEIECLSKPVSVLDKIINDMQITRLYLDFQEFPEYLNFNHPNHHLKTLVVMPVLTDLFGNQLLSAFPDIEYLSLDCNYRHDLLSTIEIIANELKSVKFLRISNWYLEYNPEIYMPSLSALSIALDLRNFESLFLFIITNPSIETLSISCDCLPVINQQILGQITHNARNLKTLLISQREFIINMEMLQMLSSNCPNLVSFQVQTDSAQSCVKYCGKVHLKYYEYTTRNIPGCIFNRETLFGTIIQNFVIDL